MKFAEQLKKYRTERGLSQDDVAAKLFVSRQAVSKWENDDGTPDLETVVRLAQLLTVSLDELVLGVESTKETPEIDHDVFTFDPTKGEYVRRRQPMNFWEFVARYWWLVFAFGWLVPPLIRSFFK